MQAISLPPTTQPPSDTAAGVSDFPSVSADGRFVTFQSTADNLVPGQTGGGGEANVFLLDRSTGATVLVSHVPGSATSAPASGPSERPLISRNGRYVVYTSYAPQIVGLPGNGELTEQVVVYDRTTGQNVVISRSNTGRNLPADGGADANAVSGDGRYIVFTSTSQDLVPNQVTTPGPNLNILYQLFLYDQTTGTTYLVSHAAGADNVTADEETLPPENASVADDGTVAYVSAADNLINGFTPPNAPGGLFNNGDVYLYSPTTQANQLISAVSGSPGRGVGQCYDPVITPDGSTVVYVSQASDLVPNQTGSGYNVFRYTRAGGTTTLVSGAGGSAAAGGNGNSGVEPGTPFPAVAVSGDGRFVAFASQATNLVPGQTGAAGNVFLYDARSPGLTLLSGVGGSSTAGAGGLPPGYPEPIDPGFSLTQASPALAISADGGLVAFVSQANTLVPGQTGPSGTDNVFLYSRAAGQTRLVTGRQGSATATDTAVSDFAVLSGDGSLLVYQSQAADLGGGFFDGNGVADVLTYSPAGPAGVGLVSRAAFPQVDPGTGDSYSTSTSADGRYTVFVSTARDLVANQVTDNSNENVFLYDKQTGTVSLVNHAPGLANTTGDGGVDAAAGQRPAAYQLPVISADGSTVAFYSTDDNLVSGEPRATTVSSFVYRYDVATGAVRLVNHQDGAPTTPRLVAKQPAVSADGRYIAYVLGYSVVGAAGGPDEGAVTLYDSVQDTNTVITGLTSQGMGGASDPGISDDGRYVTFLLASLIRKFPPLATRNVYVYDRTTQMTSLVSHDAATPSMDANAPSSAPVISHDGSAVAFVSAATDLVPSQSTGSFTNVFLYRNDGTGAVRLVSGVGGSGTAGGNGNSDSPAVDKDGGYVAYRSDAANLVAGQSGPAGNVFEFNAAAGSQTLVSHQAGSPAAAAGGAAEPVSDDDGHLISYASTAGDLVPGQGGTAGVKNVFIWLRQTGANILASGQNGSPTVGGNADSDFPLLTRDSFPGFSSRAKLLSGEKGTSVAYLNTLVALALSPNVVADGSGPGTLVGYLTVSSLLAGQYLPPVYRVPGADSAPFAVGALGNLGAPLLTRFLASHAAQASYQVSLLVDVGFGFDPLTLQVLVASPTPGPGGGGTGGGAGGGEPGGGGGRPRPLRARLVSVRTGARKTRLLVEVFFADTGALDDVFASPFRGAAFKRIRVSVQDGNGVPGLVVITARKGKKTVRATTSV